MEEQLNEAARRIGDLEGQLALLRNAVTDVMNALPATERKAAFDALAKRPRPAGHMANGYAQALSKLGRELTR